MAGHQDTAGKPVGGGKRRVKRGECVTSIAAETGHIYKTLWSDPKNAEIKNARSDPNVVMSGDRIHVPGLREKDVSASTEQRHTFRRKGTVAVLRIDLLDGSQPYSDQDYTLEIDSKLLSGTTDSNGRLEHTIPANAKHGHLKLGSEEEIVLELGALDPVQSIAGVQARLNNLGFPAGPVDGIRGPRTKRALAAFQRYNDLDVTEAADEPTWDQLLQEHGC